jgi:hypothetical protein
MQLVLDSNGKHKIEDPFIRFLLCITHLTIERSNKISLINRTTQVFKLSLPIITYKTWQKDSRLKNWKERTNKKKTK